VTITATAITEALDQKGISIWALARKMDIDQGHLRRVLQGSRPGSAKLLQEMWDTIQAMQGRRRRRIHDDLDRLVRAAVHVFFVQRGDFDSAIFAEPGEDTLYGPGRPRHRGTPKQHQTRQHQPKIPLPHGPPASGI
jgi:hypothetical protein